MSFHRQTVAWINGDMLPVGFIVPLRHARGVHYMLPRIAGGYVVLRMT